MKYKTVAERKAAAKVYQAAYRQAKKDGTWRPKSELGKGRVIALTSSSSPIPHASSLISPSSPIPHTSSLSAAKLREYNREYRRRKRAEALAKRQRTWTAAEWEKWQAREKAKELGKGSPAWFVGEVVKVLAAEEGISADDVTQRLIELEGLDFLMKGAEAIGLKKASRPGMVKGAARALGLWLDPDNALLFKLRDVKPRK